MSPEVGAVLPELCVQGSDCLVAEAGSAVCWWEVLYLPFCTHIQHTVLYTIHI
jgi:hypothetical protein